MRKRGLLVKYILFMLPALGWFAACHHPDKNAHSETVPAQNSDSLFQSDRLKKITDSIRQFPDSSNLYFERGGMLYVMKEYALAGKDIQKAIDLDPMRVDFYIALGEIQITENNFPHAANAFKKALQLDPKNLMARLQLSFSLYNQKDYEGTIRETDTLLKIDPHIARAYGIQSQAYEALKDTVKSLVLMKKAVDLAPNDYDALMAMGDLLLRHHQDSALQYYERAKAADTTQGEPLFCIGLYYMQKNEPRKATNAYKACIARDAFYVDAYLNLGKIYENENDWQDALKVYNLATQISPTSSEAFYHRGLCFEKLNNIKAAINDYENALDLKSTNAEAKAALARLKKK
ncbi:MAG: tetratricopeptide repeat protein [Chitinophagaceae bacterium]|nr:MAG: tetratricopeptide repeat protein [Chitinophagaceae bacterium]